MRVEFNFIDQSIGASEAAIKRAEINIEIFQLGTESTDYPASTPPPAVQPTSVSLSLPKSGICARSLPKAAPVVM